MGRAQRPLDPAGGPVQAFAAELRALRHRAGEPTYLRMQRSTGKSRTALAEAAGGDHLPTWETVAAFVRACGEDPDSWRIRWERTHEETRRLRAARDRDPITPGDASAERTAPPGDSAGGPPPAVPGTTPDGTTGDELLPSRAGRSRGRILVAGAVVLAAVAAGTGWAVARTGDPARPSGRTIVVQNKVAFGPSALTEDDSPSYLSERPVSRCVERGCKLAGTDLSSGSAVTALCRVQGELLTNADVRSAGVEDNPNAAASTLWYRVRWSDGRTGYLSEVYVAAEYRGGLDLPAC